MDWPLQKKLEYAVDRVPSRLSIQDRAHFGGLAQVQSLAVKLEAMADSELFEIEMTGRRRLTSLSDPVFRDLAYPTQIVAIATTKPELDVAALYMAEAIVTAGVTAFLRAMAKSELVKTGRSTRKRSRAPKQPPAMQPAPRKTALPPLSFDPPKTWIEIELVDQNKEPVPGEKYRVQLPDDSTIEGNLDAKGLARIDGIDPGSCFISFPDVDRREWSRA